MTSGQQAGGFLPTTVSIHCPHQFPALPNYGQGRIDFTGLKKKNRRGMNGGEYRMIGARENPYGNEENRDLAA
jgi:hypothetical protein